MIFPIAVRRYTWSFLAVLVASVFLHSTRGFQWQHSFGTQRQRQKSLFLELPEFNDGTDYAINNRDINNILQQNKVYVETLGKAFFAELGAKHEPKYMWIGCADARAPANEIMGEKPGSVFTVRNVANMVVSTDVNLLAALQFAVTVLEVKHIIVCGHYDCGGVRASTNKADLGGALEMWLRNLRDVYRIHREELDNIKDPEVRHRRLVELNTIEQCVNLFKTGIIQKQRVDTFKDPTCRFPAPRIHACVYDPKIGYLKNLDVDFTEYLSDLKDIYELYNPPDQVLEAELLLDAKSSNEDSAAPSLQGPLDDVWKFLGLK